MGNPGLAGVLQGLELRGRGRFRRCRLEGAATIPLGHAVRIQLADEDARSAGSGPGRLLQDLPEERAAVGGPKHDEVTGRQCRRPVGTEGEGAPVSGRRARRSECLVRSRRHLRDSSICSGGQALTRCQRRRRGGSPNVDEPVGFRVTDARRPARCRSRRAPCRRCPSSRCRCGRADASRSQAKARPRGGRRRQRWPSPRRSRPPAW